MHLDRQQPNDSLGCQVTEPRSSFSVNSIQEEIYFGMFSTDASGFYITI